MRVKPALIIQTLKRNGLGVVVTAKELGVHRTTVWRWKKRANNGRILSSRIERKSTRPKKLHFALSLKQRDEAIKARRLKHTTAEKIVRILSLSAHHSTLHRLFKKSGLVRKYGYHRRPRFQNTLHMHAKNTLP